MSTTKLMTTQEDLTSVADAIREASGTDDPIQYPDEMVSMIKTLGEGGGGGNVYWSSILNKPNTFPPSSHIHTKSEITDFPTIPTEDISANTAARHTHSNKNILDSITQTPLYEHQSLAGYVQTTDSRLSDARTPTSHSHTKSEITDFPTIPSALSDLTDDATHRVVTDTEKSTWSGKQDAISSERIGTWNTAYAHSQSSHAPSDAQKNVQSDWNATSGDALILNKPTIPAAVTDEHINDLIDTKLNGIEELLGGGF